MLNPRQPLQAMVDRIAGLPLVAQPGTRWSYSIAVDVQGYLVEKLSGQPFAEFLRTRLFEPLKMNDTGFFVPKEKLSRLALVHGEDGSGKLTPPDDSRGDPTQVPVAAFGGHGLFSTAADYARFCEMLLGGGELGGARILAPRTVEMWRTNHLPAEPLKTVRPGTGWGLGPQVVMDAAAAGEPYSDGAANWWGIGGTWFWIDPVKDFAFIGMIQHRDARCSASPRSTGSRATWSTRRSSSDRRSGGRHAAARVGTPAPRGAGGGPRRRPDGRAGGEWRYYGGDAASRKYSPLAQIAAANVDRLRVAWQWTSADDAVVAANPTARPGAYQDTPLMANGVLYTVTSLGQIAALDPGTGVARWVFDPGSWKTGRPGNLGFVHRGLAYWTDGTKERLLLGTGDAYLLRSTPGPARSIRRSATPAASI